MRLVPVQLGPSLVLGSAVAANDWIAECVDCPGFSSEMTNRSLRFEAEGRAHIASVASALCHAWHDGSQWPAETVDLELGTGCVASRHLNGNGQA